MTVERAKQIIHSLKDHHLVDTISIITDEGITVTLLPAGNAEYSELEPCRNYYYGLEITVWPKNFLFGLYHGTYPTLTRLPRLARHHLWDQEHYVYLLERHNALTKAMEEMDKIFPIPRLNEKTKNDIEPYPEDFGADRMTNNICVEAIERWLREVPIETRP